MFITNWLAVGAGNDGLVSLDKITSTQTRIYGNVHGHPNFEDGEYVRTAVVKDYICTPGVRITTTAEEVFDLKNREQNVYLKYLDARCRNVTILKYWKVINGRLAGKTLEGEEVSGIVVRQNFKDNICEFEDGRLVFVDWLSKDEAYVPNSGPEEFLLFGISRCMPDIFGKHFCMFRKQNI